MTKSNAKLLFRTSLALALAFSRPAAGAEPAAPGPARVQLVESGPASAGRWIAANVLAARRARISTRVSATVSAVTVEEGARVREGQLLVSLADAEVRAQLAAARVALASAAAHERRIAGLVVEHAATRSELEAAQAQRAQAEAGVAAAQAGLAHTEIRAPFAGTVQARRIEPGDLVGPGQPLVELEGGGLELVASASEEEAGAVAVGARLRFRAGGTEGFARVTALATGGDALSHRRTLRARVIDPPPELRSGTFARLEVPSAGPAPAAVWVPRSALVERGDLTGVFVAASGRAELRWLALGEPVGDHVPVRAGLAAAEPVIDRPGALRDGQAVEVVHGR